MSQDQQKPPQPPQPPEMEKRFRLHRYQWWGMPILLLIAVLALLGVFGASSEAAEAANDQLAVGIEYPTRFRYKMIASMEVYVENISASPVPTVTVSFDEGYIDKFSNVTFTPSPDQVTAEVYQVKLTDLQPQEVRKVDVTLQAEEWGWHEGFVMVTSAEGGEPVRIEVDTIVFP